VNDAIGIEQFIRENGIYVGTIVGVSMEPLLRTHRDVVVVEKPKGRLKKNDVALYRRGDNYVLHRVIKVLPDSYVILGDNCYHREYGITDDDVLGVLTEFYRKGKRCSVKDSSYHLYIAVIRTLQPIRIAYGRLRSKAARWYHQWTK